MRDEVLLLLKIIADPEIELRKEPLIRLGQLITHSLESVTGDKPDIFNYFVDAKARSVSCTFHCTGIFPIEIYEGVCSFRMDEEGVCVIYSDLLPFWGDERIMRMGTRSETYIYVSANISLEGDIVLAPPVWTTDSYFEWESHTSPRRQLFNNVTYFFDD